MSIESPFVEGLQGKAVTHAWTGYGSAIFLEFGQLTENPPTDRVPQTYSFGEMTLMIEWSWRVERPRSIMAGSWSSSRRRLAALKSLIGAKVTQVTLTDRLPEISLSLSNGTRVTSFMTAEGQPSWSIIGRIPQLGSLHVKRGKLCVEPLASHS